MSSLFQELKKNIDFALFSTKADNPFTLDTQLCLCQKKFNSLPSAEKIVDPASKTKLAELKKKVAEKIKELEEALSKAKKRKKEELEIRIKELKDALIEIKKIEESVTNYILKVGNKPQLDYDDASDTATVYYDGTLGSLLNELKHAFQYETGKIDFIKYGTNNIPGLAYDLNDELETYRRQFAFDGILKLNVVLSDEEVMAEVLKGNLTGMGEIEVKKMKKITAELIIKVGDGALGTPLYELISKDSLDINSSVDDIIKGNPLRGDLINDLKLGESNKEQPYLEFIKVFIKEQPFIYVKY